MALTSMGTVRCEVMLLLHSWCLLSQRRSLSSCVRAVKCSFATMTFSCWMCSRLRSYCRELCTHTRPKKTLQHHLHAWVILYCVWVYAIWVDTATNICMGQPQRLTHMTLSINYAFSHHFIPDNSIRIKNQDTLIHISISDLTMRILGVRHHSVLLACTLGITVVYLS